MARESLLYLITLSGGGQAMRNEHCRPIMRQGFQSPENFRFGRAVKSTRRLVAEPVAVPNPKTISHSEF